MKRAIAILKCAAAGADDTSDDPRLSESVREHAREAAAEYRAAADVLEATLPAEPDPRQTSLPILPRLSVPTRDVWALHGRPYSAPSAPSNHEGRDEPPAKSARPWAPPSHPDD